jgi:uncharacterized protein (DUF302 family)
MSTTELGLTSRFDDADFDDVVERTTAALADQGFGIITEIDVKATMKKKLDVDGLPYKILGACNPAFAHKALTADPQIGLLLPCNVIVYKGDDGSVTVSLVRPDTLFALVNDPAMNDLMGEVSSALKRAHDAIVG